MVDPMKLSATSALAATHVLVDPESDVTLTERSVDVVLVAARSGQEIAARTSLKDALGTEIPDRPTYVGGAGIECVWAGPGQWLVLAERGDEDLEARLRRIVAGAASVVDQSDGRVVIRLLGGAADAVLMRGLPIDLHTSRFAPGNVVISQIAYVGVHLWRLPNDTGFDLVVSRSFVHGFVEFLRTTIGQVK